MSTCLQPLGHAVTARLIDADEVARKLHIGRDWVYAEVRAGRIPHIRLGRYVRFREDSIEGWLGELEDASLAATNQSGRAPRKRPRPGTGGTNSHAT